ncbi:porin [Bradyrhizobium sp. U87765 SZCCT0134]|uniref:porin n=1 Tax=Bradyrhizobium sp. U87765 SZCCT0134 TaxID=2807660 RepID=UPI001BAC78C3|nr:porin [Bradyrhizobium sp. U87765 SZCCT0134]MBR1260482.1 porin [Bradyrhizobium sp. U87765 SZCCT0134]
MKMVKSLMLGTAAGFVALTGAQAADLPVKAKAVEYVKICSLYGAGFYYIPGTDTCIRIGGALRLDTAFNGTTYDVPFWQGSTGGANSYNRNYFTTRERLNLFIDTRTATEYGVVRTYANLQFDFLQGRESIAGGYMENDFLFIQFAGFTFGKAVSQFDPQWALAKPWIASGVNGGSNNATGIPQLAYTASFGNGVSATISLEDAQPYRSAGVVNASAGFLGPFGAATSAYGVAANTFAGNVQTGDHVPDIVANLRLDQAWGSLHFGAAAHEVHGTYYTSTNSDSGKPSSTWGYAVTGAFELKNLPTGIGDSLKVEASYAKGAAKYVWGGTTDTAGGGRYARLGAGNGTAGSMALGYVLDGVYTNGSSIDLSSAWEVSAYYEHYWTPAWRTSLFGSYTSISYGTSGNAALLAAANAPVSATSGFLGAGSFNGTNTGNFNFAVAQVGTRTAWTPVQNLTLSAEFVYSRLIQNQNGTYTVNAGVPGVAPNSTLEMKNQNLFNGSVQILRSF